MKHILAGLISLCFCATASADWKITEVAGKDKTIAGYIYHAEAVGTVTGVKVEKSATSLRLVCSNKPGDKKNNAPIVAIFWDGMISDKNSRGVDIKINSKSLGAGMYEWDAEGPLLMRSAGDSKEILQAMKVGKTIRFTWVGKNMQTWTTIFDLTGFNQDLSKFNAQCGTEL